MKTLVRAVTIMATWGRVSGKFTMNGPVLTVTLKDPETLPNDPAKWLDIGALRPNAIWSVQSNTPPLPNWFPAFKSLRTSISYNHADSPNLPSNVEIYAKFSMGGIGDVELQPSYHLKSRTTTCLVQASRGEGLNVLAKMNLKQRIFEYLKGSIVVNLPFSNSINAVRVSPAFDFRRKSPSCLLEGVTGNGRTKAVLNLNWDDPTLTVVHALDERNTIAPEISLQTAKIMYQWNVNMESGSIRTKVDPTEAVYVTWTDRSMNGRWVTDLKLPLKGTMLKALETDIKVRRQFTF